MASFFLFLLSSIIQLLEIAIIISAVLSWLIAFEVVNLRNRFVYQVSRFLDAVTGPVLAPFRRVIPPLGGIDVSPIVCLLVLMGIRRYLLPWAFGPLIGIAG